jgi:ATP-dependent helicase YprA (DUF1998 family)
MHAYRSVFGSHMANVIRRLEGELDCVIATNALELGVDIGALDLCVLNGYPGRLQVPGSDGGGLAGVNAHP